MRLRELANGFAGRRVLVLGEAMVDAYLNGVAERISREAPVPIVALEGRIDAPGGAANAAVNVAALGGRPTLLSVVGTDAGAERLRAALAERGVSDAALVSVAERATLAKERVLADGHMLVRLDTGTTTPVTGRGERELVDRLQIAWEEADAVIVSDYDYGVITPAVVVALRAMSRLHPKPLIVDARDPSRYRSLPVTAVKPNYAEAARLLGEAERRAPAQRAAQVLAARDRLHAATGARIVAVTMDRDGVLVLEADQPPHRTLARPRSDGSAAGAGDTFVAALTLALLSGATTSEAAELAAVAASVVVERSGTASCTLDDLLAALEVPQKRVADPAAIGRLADGYRRQGRRLVFTNGCFDILHRGHVAYLNRAKALGDVLIVGVNGDASVRRLKGEGRPVNPLDDRMLVLEALSCIDHVVAFDEDRPDALIRAVRPNVFAKGGDYRRETLPEAALVESLGGSVQLLPLVDDRSTTGLIARVRSETRSDTRPAPSRRAPVVPSRP
jgi:D-beta-D-heptose 7-phosphate kinase/D-beta-D-heptose 1-phosphate adenosyltransferase